MEMVKGKGRRIAVLCFGILIMGLGVALFKISLMGNDPSSAMAMAIADRLGVDFAVVLLVAQLIFFLIQLLFGRRYIGIGTFINWFFVGTLASLYGRGIALFWDGPTGLLPQLFTMLAGVLVLSLSASLYQTADLGIAPYDCMSILMDDHLPLPYFWCRIITDAACAAIAFLFGGIVGLGTLVCAVGLGPFIHFFNRHVSEKLCGKAESIR